MLLQGLSFWETTPHATFCGLFSLFTSWHLKQNSENIMFPRYYFLQKQNDGSKNSFHRCLWQARQYWVSGLEVYKNTCLCFSTQKLYAIYVFDSVQSNSKICSCTSVYTHARLTTQQWQRWPWAYNTSHADKHMARAWISFRYLSNYIEVNGRA